jgi:hypothetical protein
MMATSVTIFSAVTGSLNHYTPVAAISAVPRADQTAQATPTSLRFSP